MHEFMELVWENGEVVIRGPSSSTRTNQPSPSRAKNPRLTHSNENTKNLTSSLNKGNSCFQSDKTNRSDHPIHKRSFSMKKLGEAIMDSRLIFSKPDDVYHHNDSVKDKETCNNCDDSSTAMIGGSQNNNKTDAIRFSRFIRPNLSVSGRSAIELPHSQGDNSMNKDLKVSTTHGSCLLVKSRGQPALLADSRPLDAKNDPPPDQQSNAIEPLPESSKCSLGASNNPTLTAVRNYRRTEDQQEYHSNGDDQSENVNKSTPARGKIGVKRKRIAKLHRLAEKRRRDEINKRLQTLQELIPNCRKVDKASVLDEAIEYLKTLQLQLHMMSVSTGAYMPSPMMLPSGFMQQLQPSNLPYCPTMETVRATMMGGAVANNLRDRINLQMLGVPSSVSPVVPMIMIPPGIQSLTGFPPQSMAVTNPVNIGSNVQENIHH